MRVVVHIGGGAVAAVMYVLSTGRRKLRKLMASLGLGSRAYDSRLSIASGGTRSRRGVYVDAPRGVEYVSWRETESRSLGYVRVRSSVGRLGNMMLLRYLVYISSLSGVGQRRVVYFDELAQVFCVGLTGLTS